LSLLSNAAFGHYFANITELQTYATTIVTKTLASPTVQEYLGNWSLIWGPVVYVNKPQAEQVVADNTMMLLYNSSQNLLLAAIAGTNSYSTYAWLQEDFKVNTTKKWADITGIDNPHYIFYQEIKISTGSYNGLQILMQMQYNNQTIEQALTANLNGKAGVEFATAGHSLGGALCPVLALYMYDTKSKWDSNNVVKTISTWPTAGPTAGNYAFANYARDRLSCTSRHNTLDVIPYAWQKDLLQQIPKIYSAIPAETIIGVLAIGAVLATHDKYTKLHIIYDQIQPWHSLTGTFNQDTDNKIKNDLQILYLVIPSGLKDYIPNFVNLARFLAQMGYQHTTAYNTLLNIQSFATAYQAVLNQNPPPNGLTLEQGQREALYYAMAKTTGIVALADLAKAIEESKK